MKYMEINDLNKDQVALAESKGWCIYTQVEDACGLIYKKGLAWANRIGYVIFSESVDAEAIDGSAIGDYGTYDYEFESEVKQMLSPLEDKCYVFLIKNPVRYRFEQIWANKGLEYAKEMAKSRFKDNVKYYPKDQFDKMDKLIKCHNKKVILP